MGVFNMKAFSPPPSSGGAVSSTENPSEELPRSISPSGNASYVRKSNDKSLFSMKGPALTVGFS